MRPFLATVLIACLCPAARGDGGAVRLRQKAGPYQVTVFTSPTPLRAGLVDVSVLIQDGASGAPVSVAGVTVRAVLRDDPLVSVECPATTEAATNKLLQAAKFELPSAGWWEVTVRIEAARAPAEVRFELEAAQPLPPWRELWLWLAWPVVVIALFALHQALARRPGAAPEPPGT